MGRSGLVLITALAALGGCSNMGSTYPTADACIHDQFFGRAADRAGPRGPLATPSTNGQALFAEVVKGCGDPVPDLTGDTLVQAVAIHYNVPFRIDIAKDTRMKKSVDGQIMTTGSLIPLEPLIFPKS